MDSYNNRVLLWVEQPCKVKLLDKAKKKNHTCACVRACVSVSVEYKSRALVLSQNSAHLGFGSPLSCTFKSRTRVQENCKQPALCVNHRWFITLQQELPFISPVEPRLTLFAASSCRFTTSHFHLHKVYMSNYSTWFSEMHLQEVNMSLVMRHKNVWSAIIGEEFLTNKNEFNVHWSWSSEDNIVPAKAYTTVVTSKVYLKRNCAGIVARKHLLAM